MNDRVAVKRHSGSTRARACAGVGMSMALFLHWACNFAVGQAFLPLVQQAGVATVYCGFAAVCLAGALFVAKATSETKGGAAATGLGAAEGGQWEGADALPGWPVAAGLRPRSKVPESMLRSRRTQGA